MGALEATQIFKMTPEGKVGTVVPMHRELKIGTLKGALKLAKIDPNEFAKYLWAVNTKLSSLRSFEQRS
jgi:hypothetical protein